MAVLREAKESKIKQVGLFLEPILTIQYKEDNNTEEDRKLSS